MDQTFRFDETLRSDPELQPKRKDRQAEYLARCLTDEGPIDAIPAEKDRLCFCESQWKEFAKRMGVASSVSPDEFLTYDNGKILPREWYED